MLVFSSSLYANSGLPFGLEFGMTKEQVKERSASLGPNMMIDKEDNDLLSYTSPQANDKEIWKILFHFDDNKLASFETVLMNLTKEEYQLKVKETPNFEDNALSQGVQVIKNENNVYVFADDDILAIVDFAEHVDEKGLYSVSMTLFSKSLYKGDKIKQYIEK